jgi:RsmE family RNA methyltransferase
VNTILLESSDFIAADRVRLQGRRHDHIRSILTVGPGSEVRVGVIGGRLGTGRIQAIDSEAVELTIALDRDSPLPLPLCLILALPRPKVLNRTLAAAASLGIREIHLINAWRVEKSYWKSPKISADNLRLQCILGLEQAGDTMLPVIRCHRLFTNFIRGEVPNLTARRTALVAHPQGGRLTRSAVSGGIVLAIGPEGGFIEREIAAFCDAGFTVASFGPRILRVETALPFLAGQLF